MTDHFDKLTRGAQRALELAREEAQSYNHNRIGTEHIMVGLVREGDGIAARVLNDLGLDIEKVSSGAAVVARQNERIVKRQIFAGRSAHMFLSSRARRSIELAVDEAKRLNHNYIGTEHLLLGLLRQGEGGAVSILDRLHVPLKKVRTRVIVALGTSTELTTPDSPTSFDETAARSSS